MIARVLLILTILFASPLLLCAESEVEKMLKKPDEWFRSDEGQLKLKNVLSWQTEYGDWPKNTDTTSKEFANEKKKPAGTFDNGATSGELRVLARAFRVTGDEQYKQAFLRGFDHILAAQYANGGWPQYFPLSEKYHRHITYNDGTMLRLIEFLRDVTRNEDYKWIDEERRTVAKQKLDRGIDCILKCQVVVDGKHTVWCAQHDAETLAPVMARSYELPSLSGAESAGILRFLMTIDEPTPEIINAVKSGVSWFESAKIEGYQYRRSKTEPALTKQSNSKPIWARFYDIETNRPMFSDRDGIVKFDIEQIGSERRGGYTWYGNWGENVLKSYAKWEYR